MKNRIKLTEEQINEVVDNLEIGMKSFYNLTSGEIIAIPDFDFDAFDRDNIWQESIDEIDENPNQFFEFEMLESQDSFQIMADFAEQVDNPRLQSKLIKVLDSKKPFQKFKWEIDNSGPYRQQWFEFRKVRYIKWVLDQLDD
ncbi:MAG: hypothetical protein KDC49_07485 [Saprospiraceae bacterium]|nr:hypothetical protein [Saprospiraceae bacterium]